MSQETNTEDTGGLRPEYKTYEYQKCFVGHSQEAEWHDDILSACAEILPKFNLEPWYAADHFEPTKPLRDKVVELIANARYGIYDLSNWQDRSGDWHLPRNVLIELGMAIALNRPTLRLRHTSNKVLSLPACLHGVELLEFAGETTLKKALEKRLPQWLDIPPDRDWLNRFCIFGNRVCSFREEHPRARQWGDKRLHCHITDGFDKDHPGFQIAEREEIRGAFEGVFTRYSDLALDYLDELSLADGYQFLLCSHCQVVRSTPFAIYRILPYAPAEVFIAIGMSIALETLFEYDIPKVLLVRQEQELPSLLRGYEVVEAVNSNELKRKLKAFIPVVLQKVRKIAWMPKPLPFVEFAVQPDPMVLKEELLLEEINLSPEELLLAAIFGVKIDHETHPLDAEKQSELREWMRAILSTMPAREREILESSFGLQKGEAATPKEIGQNFGLTEEQTREVEQRALRMTRHPRRSRLLRSFLIAEGNAPLPAWRTCGIPPTMYIELREGMLDCGAFESDDVLKAVFAHPKLSPWKNASIKASISADRVDTVLAFLIDQYHPNTNENALVLLFRVLNDRIDPADECHQRLVKLTAELEHMLTGDSADIKAPGQRNTTEQTDGSHRDAIVTQGAAGTYTVPHSEFVETLVEATREAQREICFVEFVRRVDWTEELLSLPLISAIQEASERGVSVKIVYAFVDDQPLPNALGEITSLSRVAWQGIHVRVTRLESPVDEKTFGIYDTQEAYRVIGSSQGRITFARVMAPDTISTLISRFEYWWSRATEALDAQTEETINIVIQVNGRVLDQIEVNDSAREEEIRDEALGLPSVRDYLMEQPARKVIYVPGRLINIVTGPRAFVATFGLAIEDVLASKRLPPDVPTDYPYLCDWLEEDLRSRLRDSIGDFRYTQASQRNGETLSVQVSFPWQPQREQPYFGDLGWWSLLDIRRGVP